MEGRNISACPSSSPPSFILVLLSISNKILVHMSPLKMNKEASQALFSYFLGEIRRRAEIDSCYLLNTTMYLCLKAS